eukprot:4654950-Alexandrium_andersonii.AAC.1
MQGPSACGMNRTGRGGVPPPPPSGSGRRVRWRDSLSWARTQPLGGRPMFGGHRRSRCGGPHRWTCTTCGG